MKMTKKKKVSSLVTILAITVLCIGLSLEFIFIRSDRGRTAHSLKLTFNVIVEMLFFLAIWRGSECTAASTGRAAELIIQYG